MPNLLPFDELDYSQQCEASTLYGRLDDELYRYEVNDAGDVIRCQLKEGAYHYKLLRVGFYIERTEAKVRQGNERYFTQRDFKTLQYGWRFAGVVFQGHYYRSIPAAAKVAGIPATIARSRLKRLLQYRRIEDGVRVPTYNPLCAEVDDCFRHDRQTRRFAITVKGRRFNNLAAACEYHNVSRDKVQRLLKLLKDPTPEEIDACFVKAAEPSNASDVPVTVKGRRFATIAEAAACFGVNRKTASRKLKSIDPNDPSAVDACFDPPSTHTRNPKAITVRGKTFRSVSAAAKHFGISQTTADSRLKKIDRNSQAEVDRCFR